MCIHGKHRKDSAFLYCEVQSFMIQNCHFSRPARAAFYIFTVDFFNFSARHYAVHASPCSYTTGMITDGTNTLSYCFCKKQTHNR